MPENTLSESRRIALFEKSNFLSGKFNVENACKNKKKQFFLNKTYLY